MFFSDEYFANPHPILARSRAASPVQQVTDPGGREFWTVTRYAEARAALADPRLRKRFTPPEQAPLFHMLNSDPPEHTRLRKPLTSAFTVRRVQELRPRITAITTELLDAAPDPFDLVADLALPLPFRVVNDLLGVPSADRDELSAWGAVLTTESHDEAYEAADQAMTAYFHHLVGAKRTTPDGDLLSALVADGALTDQELVDTALLVLTAGYETTVNLIANGVLALLNHPEELAALRADRSRLPCVIEEVLRFDGPLVFATPRFTAEDVRIGDTTIPARSAVLVSLAAANRDPAQFPAPDTFAPARPGGHLAFGHGIHYCLGAPLARLEAEIAVTELLNRYRTWELTTPTPTYQHSILFRGPTALPMRLA
jgi:cytochrome P450